MGFAFGVAPIFPQNPMFSSCQWTEDLSAWIARPRIYSEPPFDPQHVSVLSLDPEPRFVQQSQAVSGCMSEAYAPASTDESRWTGGCIMRAPPLQWPKQVEFGRRHILAAVQPSIAGVHRILS